MTDEIRNPFPRQCEKCFKGMSEGYCIEDETYCSDECAFDEGYTKEQYLKDYEAFPDGNVYWTEWTLEDDEEGYPAQAKTGAFK